MIMESFIYVNFSFFPRTVTLFPGEKDKRLDRILLGSQVLRPHAVEIAGIEPLRDAAGVRLRYKNGALFPSDHFALFAVLSISPSSALAPPTAGGGIAGARSPREEKCGVM